MKFTIPKITRELKLAEYAPEYGEASIKVWVNPPMSLRQAYAENQAAATGYSGQFAVLMQRIAAMAEQKNPEDRAQIEEFETEVAGINGGIQECNQEAVRLLSQLWSQSPNADEHWSEEEIWELINNAKDTDPGLIRWLKQRTVEMISDHLRNVKKS